MRNIEVQLIKSQNIRNEGAAPSSAEIIWSIIRNIYCRIIICKNYPRRL